MEALLQKWQAAGCRLRALTCGLVMARVYALLFESAIQTAGSLELPNVSGLAEKSIRKFQACISEADAIGALGIEGQSLLGLGQAFSALGKSSQATEALTRSVAIFERINATHHLNRARTILESI